MRRLSLRVVCALVTVTSVSGRDVDVHAQETLKLNNDSVFFFMFFIGIILTVGAGTQTMHARTST
eukprot:6161657-Amphidinium_carterae.1